MKNEETRLTKSLEDYLETILILEKENKVARVKKIAQHLNVKMPSVTGALKNLKSKGLIKYEKNSFITLTKEGKEIAICVDKKHHILFNFLYTILKLPKESAIDKACQIEHIIDGETANKFKNLNSYLLENHTDLINSSKWDDLLKKEL